jgi:hypothetical protein
MHLALFPLDEQTCTLDVASCKIDLAFYILQLTFNFIPDGWTKNDLVYVWKEGNPVQLAGNLSLPGGFKLGAFGSQYCDVITATGQLEYWILHIRTIFMASGFLGFSANFLKVFYFQANTPVYELIYCLLASCLSSLLQSMFPAQ